jgi:Tol biopolymer transport system component
MATVDEVPQIFTIEIGESKPRQLTFSKAPKDDPAWSPDGKTIMYWANVDKVRHIYLLSVDDPQEPGRRVTSGGEGPVNDPSWSPDGRTIAYTHVTGDGISDIWLIGADGTNARALTDDPAREMDPTWSPDGGWIGFVRGPLGEPKITIIKADGSEEHTLTRGAAREGHPGWS